MVGTEAALAAIGLYLVHDPFVRTILATLAFTGYFTLLYNVSPIWLTDGYDFLQDLIPIPDLRSRSLAYVFQLPFRRGGQAGLTVVERRSFLAFGLFCVLFILFTAYQTAFVVIHFISPQVQRHLGASVVLPLETVTIGTLTAWFILGLLREAGIVGRARRRG